MKSLSKALTTLACLISVMFFAGPAGACMAFGKADPDQWAQHATIIVEATITGVSRAPLENPGDPGTSTQGANTFVLTLDVHRTLRGKPQDARRVATRFWNTTIVDETYLRGFQGKRREFALIGAPHAQSTYFQTPVAERMLPRHDGFHVFDHKGAPLDEIWEGLCSALPIFEVGTFRR